MPMGSRNVSELIKQYRKTNNFHELIEGTNPWPNAIGEAQHRRGHHANAKAPIRSEESIAIRSWRTS